MTAKDAKAVLKHPDFVLVLTALSYVNLTDREIQTLLLRHMRGHTQEETAEELNISVNGLQIIEKTALLKCAAVWKNKPLTREMLKSTV